MGFIKEPLDVDFVVDSRPLTKKEKEAISKYIRDYKAKQSENKKTLKTSRKKKKTAV